MQNNAMFGFMVQNAICKKYNIDDINEKLANHFESNKDERLVEYIEFLVDKVFDSTDLVPVKCTTFNIDSNGKEVPYNFELLNGSTLSIRTNVNGYKVAPRVIGQAGFEKLNMYFKDIYGKPITTQEDIKELFILHVDKVLPIFINKLLDAEYILWIFEYKKEFQYHLLKKSLNYNIDFKRENFIFTKDFNEWKESTTLKYKGVSLAEIQIHKKRSFKLRFNMKKLIPLLGDALIK